ncbi:DUF1127 domain-containing protein [Piscinibacter sakaiensis]|uniref:DUF1127 domain-containing protein n=1 Tax=Piscinibacter sakaiensis TaxID=1547922 RepID=UPI003AACEC72
MTQANQLCHPTPLPTLLAAGRNEALSQSLLTRLFIALQRWRYHGRMRRELLTLDDRMLKDIGLTRTDVEQAVNMPIWQVWARHELHRWS